MVVMKLVVNESSENRRSRQDFPTPAMQITSYYPTMAKSDHVHKLNRLAHETKCGKSIAMAYLKSCPDIKNLLQSNVVPNAILSSSTWKHFSILLRKQSP